MGTDSTVRIECSKADLLKALNHVRIGARKRTRSLPSTTVEVNIRPQNAELSNIGAKYTIDCVANCYAKVFLPFAILLDFVEHWNDERITIDVSAGQLKIGSSLFESKGIQVVHPENQPKIDLALNYDDIDLMKLRYKHTPDELRRMNLIKRIEKAEERMHKLIRAAYEELKIYGVTYSDVEAVVESKLQDK